MKIIRDLHPKAKLPDNRQTPVWHYMDFWKFESLLNTKALYLCRADKQYDRFEGRYSSQQIFEMNKWLEAKGYPELVEHEKKHRQAIRKKFFISCWCMYSYDLDLMWKAYTKKPSPVVIQITMFNQGILLNGC